MLLALLVIFAGLPAAYALFARVAWRDLSLAEIERRYGDAALRAATVDGLAIRYKLEGSSDANAPTVVLIHQHFFEMGIWDAWVPLLAPHFRVLRYDLSGHGFTGPDPSGNYSVERDLALLNGLLNRLGIDQVSVVGASIGGSIAFAYAARHPQRVERLVLMNAGGLRRAQNRSGSRIPGWAEDALRLLPPRAFHKLLTWMIKVPGTVTEALKQRFVDMWRREGNRGAEVARLRQFTIADPEAELATITAPTLILWGELNPQLPVAQSEQFAQKLTRAQRVQRKIYPGAGHALMLELPRETAADTLAFLQATA